MSGDRYLERAGARIAFEIKGSGEPVVYGHGVLLSREAVRGLGLFDVDRLAGGHRLLVFDQRGHGRSTGRAVAQDYRFESVGLDLLALMDQVGGGEPVDVVGSSLGCAAALCAASAAPGRIRKLVLMIPPAAWEEGVAARRWYLDSAERIEAGGAQGWREELAGAEPLPIFAEYSQFAFTPDISDELVASALHGVGLSDLPEPAEVAALPHPALVLAWDTDPLHPVSTAERLGELLPHSMVHVSKSVADIKTWTDRVVEFLQ
ncbi:alpha/beta hydrolase [Nocardia sp. 2]|uniref:Alpha/beta hydrolase n=1 Tax=Nocardia acididurans TaxID=2802282 RepID=A0ABS1M876_9NOCA|nr:alpha/beta hydrolase [Nocardia acididurans]MBL1076848.1 alpha/beta hydrolase [Nocardia acididurans]